MVVGGLGVGSRAMMSECWVRILGSLFIPSEKMDCGGIEPRYRIVAQDQWNFPRLFIYQGGRFIFLLYMVDIRCHHYKCFVEKQ